MNTETINSKRIREILFDCLFNEEEIKDLQPGELPKHCVKAEGIIAKVGLHGERLKSHEEEIKAMLALLPDVYRKTNGGGMSFLNMCEDRNGIQWTGEHRTMDELIVLGLGLNLVGYCMPREMWDVLPGGMPYIWIDL